MYDQMTKRADKNIEYIHFKWKHYHIDRLQSNQRQIERVTIMYFLVVRGKKRKWYETWISNGLMH